MAHVDNATNIGLEDLANTYLTREKVYLQCLPLLQKIKRMWYSRRDKEGRVNSYKESLGKQRVMWRMEQFLCLK